MNTLAVIRRKMLRQLAVLAGAGIALVVTMPNANAVPSYARQTGSECAACHGTHDIAPPTALLTDGARD